MNSRANSVDWQTPTRRRAPSNRAGDSQDVLVLDVETGFGSAFRDRAAEESNHPREVVEPALAHIVQNEVEAAYGPSDLFDRRRQLMDEWSAYVVGGAGSAG